MSTCHLKDICIHMHICMYAVYNPIHIHTYIYRVVCMSVKYMLTFINMQRLIACRLQHDICRCHTCAYMYVCGMQQQASELKLRRFLLFSTRTNIHIHIYIYVCTLQRYIYIFTFVQFVQFNLGCFMIFGIRHGICITVYTYI